MYKVVIHAHPSTEGENIGECHEQYNAIQEAEQKSQQNSEILSETKKLHEETLNNISINQHLERRNRFNCNICHKKCVCAMV